MPSRPSPSPRRGTDFRDVTPDAIERACPSDSPADAICAKGYAETDVSLASTDVGRTDSKSQFQSPTPISHEVSVALKYGLELVRYGAMLVADEGRLRLANRAALSILERRDGLWLSNPGLVADRASDTRLLLRLLHEAISAPEQGEPKDSPILLPRKVARTALIVRVVPGPGIDCWPGTNSRSAMLMLYDQDIALDVNISLLVRLYGLTLGEAALAASLMRGRSIEEAAEELFISPHTARTHLKRIFMKTDTHRQPELVVKMFPAAW